MSCEMKFFPFENRKKLSQVSDSQKRDCHDAEPTHLRDKYQTERPSVAEDDERGDDDERSRLFLTQDEANGYSQDAHNRHVIDGDAYVLGVVQGGDLHLPRLPG